MKLLTQKRLAGDLIFWFFFIKKKEQKAMIKPIPISVRPFFLSKKEFLWVNQKNTKQGWEMSEEPFLFGKTKAKLCHKDIISLLQNLQFS
jgi:hypothetical protein